MGFVALIFALLIEQGRPLPERNPVHRGFAWLADVVMNATMPASAARRGRLVRDRRRVGRGPLALEWLLAELIHPLALFCLHVAVLYLTIGFPAVQPRVHAKSSLRWRATTSTARGATLQAWLSREDPTSSRPAARDAPVERDLSAGDRHALVAAHRHVFGPLFWYIVLPGAVGPVLYRIAEMLARRWGRGGRGRTGSRNLRLASQSRAYPGHRLAAGAASRRRASRSSAISRTRYTLARRSRGRYQRRQRALLLAAGGGALGLRVAEPALEARWASEGSEQGFEGQGAEPGGDGLRSAVGLVWRSVVLWVALFAMLTLASWLGR